MFASYELTNEQQRLYPHLTDTQWRCIDKAVDQHAALLRELAYVPAQLPSPQQEFNYVRAISPQVA